MSSASDYFRWVVPVSVFVYSDRHEIVYLWCLHLDAYQGIPVVHVSRSTIE
uniref:Uncharacterized protein n=1 Tax=Leviviridae sp. TaxID=2027243 RepID=A0A514D0K2_9VIRU|nr:MAG: hypothetical protein H2Bulk35175e2950_000002 [Leviviridae sp.]